MLTITQISGEEYSKFWRENNLHILQSFAWGKVKESEGWQIRRLGIWQDGKPVEVLSIQIKKAGASTFAYIPKIKYFKFWNELKEFCSRELKLDFVIVEFDEPASIEIPLPSFFKPYNDHIQPAQTNVVKLHKNEEELFAGLKGNYRRNIKKAQKDNIICNFYTGGEMSTLDKFYSVLEQIFANTKFLPRSKKYFEKIWQEMSQEKLITIITADMGQEVLGSYLIVHDHKGAYELYGGVTRNGRDHEAGYLLKWEAIKFFNLQNKSFYDHWGVAKRFPDGTYDHDELFNISLFKEGFGGEYIEFYPAQVLVINPVKYNLFKIFKTGSKAITGLKKLLK
jgi:lipid II:glycine glycyltransferase (peptidoglycan interpeptide bridge formation enzyme)